MTEPSIDGVEEQASQLQQWLSRVLRRWPASVGYNFELVVYFALVILVVYTCLCAR